MKRGFKSAAERTAVAAREAIGAELLAAFDPWQYAGHVGVIVLDFSKLDLSERSTSQLLRVDAESWSGMTLKVDEKIAVVLNPVHARTRQRSTLMHELAHLILRHAPSAVQVSSTGMLLLSDYSDEQEDEADWLSAAVLLPRDALILLRGQGRSSSQIAATFGVSPALCEWRLRMTGVDVQLRRARR